MMVGQDGDSRRGWDWDDALRSQARRWTTAMPEVLELIEHLKAAHARRVYDLGCGVGRHTLPLAAAGFEVIASDVSPSAIAHSRAALDDAGLHAELLQLEMSDMPFPAGHFDAAVAINVVYHARVSDVEGVLQGLHRVVKPGGALIITFKSTHDSEYGVGRRIDARTFAPTEGIERGIPHYYVDDEELQRLMGHWELLSSDHRVERSPERTRAHWLVRARRPAGST